MGFLLIPQKFWFMSGEWIGGAPVPPVPPAAAKAKAGRIKKIRNLPEEDFTLEKLTLLYLWSEEI